MGKRRETGREQESERDERHQGANFKDRAHVLEQRAQLEDLLKFKGGAKILTELPPTEGRFP